VRVPYDAKFSPPAPVIELLIVHPYSGALIPYKGKLDTGADSVVLPLELTQSIGLRIHGFRNATDFAGRTIRLPRYFVDIHIEGRLFLSVACIATNRETVLLGRSVLNRLVVSLNGPELELTIE
jgi:predicted aspartyl protease